MPKCMKISVCDSLWNIYYRTVFRVHLELYVTDIYSSSKYLILGADPQRRAGLLVNNKSIVLEWKNNWSRRMRRLRKRARKVCRKRN